VHDAFAIDGHATVFDLVPRSAIEAFRPVIDSAVQQRKDDPQGRIDDYSRLFTQVTNIWRFDDAARRIVFDRRFASVASRLLAVPSVRLYHDQALFKPPGAARTPWHRDRYYWPLATDRTITMWLPLVDVDDEMGAMIFASGSHRTGDLRGAAISEQTDLEFASLIARQPWKIVHAPLAAGGATFHAGATLHSAGANRSPRSREVLTVIYFDADARLALPANDNQRADLEVFFPGLGPGDIAASDLNPVLYP
jgi:hypothetical protein